MITITLQYPSAAEAAAALSKLAGAQPDSKEAAAPAGKSSAATPAPSPRTAGRAAPTEGPAAQEPSGNTPAGAKPTKPDAAANSAGDAKVTPEMVTALIVQGFVPKHKDAAVAILAEFGVARGKDLTDEQRPAAYAKLVAKAKELGIEIPPAA